MNTMVRLNATKRRAVAACVASICAGATPFASAAFVVPVPPNVWHEIPNQPATIVTNCDDSGPGSLRDALGTPDDGTIVDLSQLTCSTISLTTGSIKVGASDIGIIGPGSNKLTIDASQSPGYSVIYDLGGGTLHLRDITLSGGSKYRSGSGAHGGCVYSSGNLDMRNTIVENCSARANDGDALGGAIFADGMAYLNHSIVTQSHARATGYASGGGVYALGGIQMMYSTVSHSYCFSDTSTPGFGGAVFSRGAAFIMGSTISDSSAVRMGGLALADRTGAQATLVNSTISNNTAFEVGGVFALQPLDIYNSTIAFNNSTIWDAGTGHFLAAGLYVTFAGEMDSSIVSQNINPAAPFPTADITGGANTGFSGGNNNVMFCGVPCPTDTSHDDPGLHPLMDNGGPTRTIIPTPGAQWDIFGGTNLLNLQWEQRGPGFPRQSSGDFPEIGAVQINSDIIFANGFN